MAENRVKIDGAKHIVVTRPTAARRNGGPWLAVAAIVLVLLLTGGVFLAWPRHVEHRPALVLPPVPTTKPSVAAAAADPQPADLNGPAAVADDGESLWMSPTAGAPIQAGYLLPGTQLLLQVRVADLLAHAEGDKLIAALGPCGQQIAGQLTSQVGFGLAEIETLLVGIRPISSGSLETVLRLQLKQPGTDEELASRLPGSRAAADGRQAYYSRNEHACFLPNQAAGKILVCCPTAALSELLAGGERPPLFPRELERVLQRTDAMRLVTLVFAGKFMQINGGKCWPGTGELLLEALLDFLGDQATATALSALWVETFFLELQSTVALNERPHRFAAVLQQRLSASGDRVEAAIFAAPPDPYGGQVLARFPAMLRMLGDYTRSGEEQGLSVLRCYLPVQAGHNLVMAAELLLNSPVSQGVSAAGDLPPTPATQSPSVAERLQQTTSLVFSQETLQTALEMLSADLGWPIEIAGRDLQLEGITKNQSFGLDLRDRPAGDILLAVLARANPDRTASGPHDRKQKLVYVLRAAAGRQPAAIVVTTRAAAQRRGEKLPPAFEPTVR